VGPTACIRTSLDAETVHRALAAAGLIEGAYPGAEWACDRFVACACLWWWLLSVDAGSNVLPFDPLFVALAMSGEELRSPIPARASRRRVCSYPVEKTAEDYQLWLLPVNDRNEHWWLLAVHLDTKAMTVYDSLNGRKAKQTHKDAVAMVKRHFEAKGGPSSWNVSYIPTGVPRQSDGSSCGYFVAEFGRRLCTSQPMNTPVSVADTVREVLSMMVSFNQRGFGR
jgi:hypothetical protein